MIIGFTGPKGSGKTTCAEILADRYDGVVLNFADPLKKFLKHFMNFTNEQLHTMEGKETVDPRYGVTPRRVMECFGTDFIRECVPNLWVVKMAEQLDKYDDIFVGDLRFNDEADLIRSRGGLVVHLRGRGVPPEKDAPRSEQGILFHPDKDELLDNSVDDVEKLSRILIKFAEAMNSTKQSQPGAE